MITLASIAAHLLDGLDSLTLARAVHRMARQIDSLTALASAEGDRADVAEAAAEEYRRLYEDERAGHARTTHTYNDIKNNRDLLAKQRDEALAALSRSRAAEEQARWEAMGENRKRRDLQAERDAMLSRVAKLEAELAKARAEHKASGITPALSTAQIGERLYLGWEAKNAHGGDPIEPERSAAE